jgi:hypothetical protein
MPECRCPPRPDDAAEPGECPRSGTPGHAVDLNTVKALLTSTALARITGSPHRFCADPACPIVYFSRAGDIYTAQDLRVPVWQKEPPGARMVCYCFGENEADIGREIEEHRASHAVERVRAHIAAARCACELRNPRGVCCLADVIAAVKRMVAHAEIGLRR